MKMSLYQIDEQILACLDDETGEILNTEKLEALGMAREQKIEGISLFYKNTLAEVEALKKEEQAFATRRKSAESLAERLKNHLEYALCGQTFQTPKVKISYRKSEQVDVTDVFVVDEKWYKEVVPTVDKVKVKTALKQGVEVKGCQLVEKQNIQIK